MDNLEEVAAFVNSETPSSEFSEVLEIIQEQIDFHKGSAEKYKHQKYRAIRHEETASNFRRVRNYLDELRKQASKTETSSANKKVKSLSLTQDDLEGLPEELVNELSISSADKAEFLIMSLIDAAGGMMSLDQLLVGIFRETGEINKRTTLTARLYRMAQKDLIHSVPSKKGVYAIGKLDEDEPEQLDIDE